VHGGGELVERPPHPVVLDVQLGARHRQAVLGRLEPGGQVVDVRTAAGQLLGQLPLTHHRGALRPQR
jgi:hypothetical protein